MPFHSSFSYDVSYSYWSHRTFNKPGIKSTCLRGELSIDDRARCTLIFFCDIESLFIRLVS